ncbi:MAG: PEP-CTERM sorting domain-containing protein [Pseudomonadota bacterium]
MFGRTLIGLVTGLLAIVALTSNASATIFTVNETINTGGVSGFIETDGTQGTLTAANIVDWNLTLSANGTFTVLGPASGDNSELLIVGTALSATATDLLFDFTAGSGFVLFQNPRIGTGINYWCLQIRGCALPQFPNMVVHTTGRRGIYFETRLGLYSFGTVAAPVTVAEPASLLLLGIGLLGLAAASRHRGRVV